MDSFGHVGGMTLGASSVARTKDALGNTTSTLIEGGTATLQFDGLARLRHILRADGSEITLTYRPDGALLGRTVVCAGGATNCVPGETLFVYAGLQLLEEYAVVGGMPSLRLRYYYEDSDIPLGADVFDGSPNPPQRVWFETDRLGSVIGILDEAGNELERIRYDAFGRPTYEPPDLAPPVISSVTRQADQSLVVAFTEQVLPPPSAGGETELISTLEPLADAFVVRDHSTSAEIVGSWELDEGRSGFDRGTTLRFVPGVALPLGTHVDLGLQAGRLMDRSSNRVVAAALALTLTAGVVYSGPAQGSTAVAPTPRSAVGVDLGFSAHLHDATSGLILARARVLDPLTGAFLQRDPNGYQDSVNQYAYGANDPINHRDPTGRLLDVLAVGLLFGPKAAAGYAARVGQHLVSALADTTNTMCGPACALLDAALGQPLHPETALEKDSQAGFLEKLNPLNQALRSGLTAAESSGFEQGEQIADAARGLVDAGLTAAGGAKLTTGVAAKIAPKLKSLRNNVALSWRLRFPGELGPQAGTETLYHQGSLLNGRVAGGRPLSTSPDSDLSHYSPEGELHRFDVPRALLEKWKAEGSLSRGTDYHQPTGLVRPEVRFGGDVSAELNKYRVPPTE